MSSTPPGDDGDPSRRKFLKIATCTLGAGIGAGVAIPAARYLLGSASARPVIRGKDPIDVAALDDVILGAPPIKVAVVAPAVRDAWTAVTDVALGAAWLRRISGDKVEALSSVCPHLGCAIGWDTPRERFNCPCHDSSFQPSGVRITGPSPRDMDPLPLVVSHGRILVTWKSYRMGQGSREET